MKTAYNRSCIFWLQYVVYEQIIYLTIFIIMENWETAFSFSSCSCQKSRQIPQNAGLGCMLTGAWRESIAKYFPQALHCPLLASPSTDGVPSAWDQNFTAQGVIVALAWPLHCWRTYHLWGLWLTVYCLQVGKPIFWWCQWVAHLADLAESCPSHWHNGSYSSILGHSSAGSRQPEGGVWGHLKIPAFSIQDY